MFAEWYPGENADIARRDKIETNVKDSAAFSCFIEIVSDSVKEYHLLLKKTCTLGIRQKHKNQNDKFFCYATTCQNCGKCCRSSVSIYMDWLDKGIKNNWLLVKHFIEVGENRFYKEVNTKLNQFKRSIKNGKEKSQEERVSQISK